MNYKSKSSLLVIVLVLGLIILYFYYSKPSDQDYIPYLNFQAQMVDDQLISSSFPRGEISFDEKIQYIGSETFILYEVARCEIHLFAELDSIGGYERIFWIQYEGYLPSKLLPFPANFKPGGLSYDYSEDPYIEKIEGKEFFVRTGLFTINFTLEELNSSPGREDSDFTRVARLLHQKGININSEVLSVRMVHLNDDKSDELMIIYYESLDENDERIQPLAEKGKESPQWDYLSKQLIDRALSSIKLSFSD